MSTPINDGGPAFPYFNPDTEVVYPGMSLRDWFAGQALAGLAASEDEVGTTRTVEERTTWAFSQADAMLAERNTNTHDQ